MLLTSKVLHMALDLWLRFVCRFLGHEWKLIGTNDDGVSTVVCMRCGGFARIWRGDSSFSFIWKVLDAHDD